MIRLFGRTGALSAAAAVTLLTAFATMAQAGPITFTLNGGGGVGSVGNSLTFTDGGSGISVTATAWSYWNPGGSVNDEFLPAALGQWSQGLAVCNAREISTGGGCSTSGEHQVDNDSDSSYDFDAVLFRFNQPVDLVSMRIVSTDGSDLDAAWWAGTPSIGASLNDLSLSELASFFGVMYTGSSEDTGTPTLNPPAAGQLVTALMFGAPWDEDNDAFKIKSLTLEEGTTTQQLEPVPEPASLLLFGTGLLGLGARARRRFAAKRQTK